VGPRPPLILPDVPPAAAIGVISFESLHFSLFSSLCNGVGILDGKNNREIEALEKTAIMRNPCEIYFRHQCGVNSVIRCVWLAGGMNTLREEIRGPPMPFQSIPY